MKTTNTTLNLTKSILKRELTTSSIQNNFTTSEKEEVEILYVKVLETFCARTNSRASVFKTMTFLTADDIANDVNTLQVQIFLDELRAKVETNSEKSFIEVLLYPISKTVNINKHAFGNLIDKNEVSQESLALWNEVKSSKETLLAFRKFIFKVSTAYFKEELTTNVSTEFFEKQILAVSEKDEVQRRMILVAYFLLNVMEHLLQTPLSKSKQNKLKSLIKHLNNIEKLETEEEKIKD